MYELLRASTGAGVGRSLLERAGSRQGGDDLVNQLTAGLGTIESAEPAGDLWRLGRLVAASPALTTLFDDGERTSCRSPAAIGRSPTSSTSSPSSIASSPATVPAGPRSGSSPSRRGERNRPSPWRPSTGCGMRRPNAIPEACRAGSPRERAALAAATRAALPAPQALGVRRRDAGDHALLGAPRGRRRRRSCGCSTCPATSLIELARRAGPPPRRPVPADDRRAADAPSRPTPSPTTIAERRAPARLPAGAHPAVLVRGRDPTAADLGAAQSDRVRPDASGARLTGLGVCAGTATGPARVITDPGRSRRARARRHPRRADHRPVVDAAVPRRRRRRRRRRRPAEPRRDRRSRAGHPRRGQRRAARRPRSPTAR